MTKLSVAFSLALAGCLAFAAGDYYVITFDKTALSDTFYAEGATFGDLNGDGAMDLAEKIVAGSW